MFSANSIALDVGGSNTKMVLLIVFKYSSPFKKSNYCKSFKQTKIKILNLGNYKVLCFL